MGGKKKKIERCRSERVIALECVFWIRLICLYICVCLLKEQWGCYVIISIPVMDVWIDIFHIIDMEMCTYSVICYTYCYTFDMLSLTTGLPMWICSYFFLFTFSPPQRFLTVHDNMVPFSLTQPVIIVHRVNLALFYFAFCFSLFRTCQWTFLINFEAVAKCVSLNPTVDTQMPCVHASCAYVYIVCKPVNIFDICGCEWNEPMYTVL